MIKSILISPIKRNLLTKKMFRVAKETSKTKAKKLMVIGDPCSGNYFQFMSSMFPNCEHGDVTVDLYGCDDCNRMDIPFCGGEQGLSLGDVTLQDLQ